MAGAAVGEDGQYWAFISYSHKDAAFGRRLHRRLESYALPKRLIGRQTPRGIVPRRLIPIFRDRDELPAAADLSAQVRAALAASRSLIVVCSPASAASPWVSREVEAFRQLHPGRPIFGVIAEGEPPGCFPDLLRRSGDGGMAIEPLAADFRSGRDGSRLGVLKLVAGIAGVGLDELVQRDAQRRSRRVTAVTAAAAAAVVLMAALTLFALNARTEAVRQRGEAEGLVEFMLTDLRDKLKGVGRLDIMGAVNARALRYYSDEDLKSLPVESLERRARILHAMGEDDETRGDHDAALAKFREAHRTTAALLAQAPNDPERIFDHAQSEYWLGFVDYQRGRFAAAKPAFLRYKQMADRMHAIAPENTKYKQEVAYADGNLCAIARKPPVDIGEVMRRCGAALVEMENAAEHPDRAHSNQDARSKLAYDLMESLADMAEAYALKGDLNRAKWDRLEEEAILKPELTADPKNLDLWDTWVAAQFDLARIDQLQGNAKAAHSRFEKALAKADRAVRMDPHNKFWSEIKRRIERDLSGTTNQ